MFAAQQVAYHQTNAFSRIVLDYLNGEKNLQPFYSVAPSKEGFRQVIEKRKNVATDRQLLVEVLAEQYASLPVYPRVQENIKLLSDRNTFTVTTAHQPNLFTGPLYFIYKILHAIKLAEELQRGFSEFRFVPVFYMGSEDADLAELNHFTVRGKRYTWNTNQTGAVGRMKVDTKLLALVDELESQVGVEPFGAEVIKLLRNCYQPGLPVQQATLQLAHQLFGRYGLVVLIADDSRLKKQMLRVFSDDLFHQAPSVIVSETCKKLELHYKVQAHPREINLFYFNGDVRERIEQKGSEFCVVNTNISFTADALTAELEQHPERFSPNVILRGLYQETILPNVAFVGGGGELAYWLQLKNLFDNYEVPFPVLLLRNSFLLVEKHQSALLEKLELGPADCFQTELQMLHHILEKQGLRPQLNGELSGLETVFEQLKARATSIDPSLRQHVEALKTKSLRQLDALEKKMLRAERKKHEAVQRQISKLKQQLFPANSLQERVENVAGYYARWGLGFIEGLYAHSKAMEQQFCILIEE